MRRIWRVSDSYKKVAKKDAFQDKRFQHSDAWLFVSSGSTEVECRSGTRHDGCDVKKAIDGRGVPINQAQPSNGSLAYELISQGYKIILTTTNILSHNQTNHLVTYHYSSAPKSSHLPSPQPKSFPQGT